MGIRIFRCSKIDCGSCRKENFSKATRTRINPLRMEPAVTCRSRDPFQLYQDAPCRPEDLYITGLYGRPWFSSPRYCEEAQKLDFEEVVLLVITRGRSVFSIQVVIDSIQLEQVLFVWDQCKVVVDYGVPVWLRVFDGTFLMWTARPLIPVSKQQKRCNLEIEVNIHIILHEYYWARKCRWSKYIEAKLATISQLKMSNELKL